MPERVRVDERDLSPLVDRARGLIGAGRRLLGLAGAPGVGKSTVAAGLVAALAPDAVLVPLDGFHLADAELRRLGRHPRKGAPDTFDATGYRHLLRRLRGLDPATGPDPATGLDRATGPDLETVYAPRFDRHLEDSIAAAIPVPPELPLVVTEGNYLLLDTGPWAPVQQLLDQAWFLERDESERLARLTARHADHGRSSAEAAARARGCDQRNAELVAATRERADLLVWLSCGGAVRG